MAESLISKEPRLQNVDMETSMEGAAYRRPSQDKFLSLTKIYDEHERKKHSNMHNYGMLTNWKLKTENENKEVVEKQRSRRSRKDKEGRDHICGCGKMYLSYPALYTHIKQKHEGKPPEGTFRMNSNGPSRRGRPRRERKEESIHSIEENPTKNEVPRVLKDMIKPDKLIIFEQYEQQVRGTILPECIRYPKFLQQLELIKKQHLKQITPDLPIDRILSIYLYNMTDIVNEQFFFKLEEILVLLRTCLNRHHKQMERCYQKVTSNELGDPIEDTSGLEYCETHTCEYLPLIAEYFVLRFIPATAPTLDQKLVTIAIHDLCEWVWENKLSHLRLSTYSVEAISNFSLSDIQLD